MKRTKIVLFGRFGSGNIGNDSSFEAALDNIQKRNTSAEIICVCNGPEAIAERFSIKSLPIDISEHRDIETLMTGNFLLSTVRRLIARIADEVCFWLQRPSWFRSVDQFIVVGTGAVDDMAVKPWNAPYDLFKWCKCAKMGGTKVVFLSVGVGPILNRVSRFLMLRALRMADYRSYREIGAVNYLRSVGFDTSSDYLYPDLVFSLDEKYNTSGLGSKRTIKNVGLGVINYYGWEHDVSIGEPVYQDYLSKIKQFIVWLLEKGYTIRLLRGDKTDNRPVDEIVEFVRNTGSLHGQNGLILNDVTTAGGLFEEIAQTDIVVASRFHNVLCALMLERPVISLGYHNKNIELMADMGFGEYCQHIESFTVEKLIQQFRSHEESDGNFLKKIREQNLVNRQLLSEQYDKLLLLSLIHLR